MARFNIHQVFVTESDVHTCCSCCDGFCPAFEGSGTFEDQPMFGPICRVGDYLSDRVVAIRSDLINLPDHVKPLELMTDLPAAMTVPESMPKTESRASFNASFAGKLIAAGIDILHSDDHPQHLYLGDEHVGWIMHGRTESAVTLSTVRKMIQICDRPTADGLADLLDALPGDRLDALQRVLTARVALDDLDLRVGEL